MRFMAAPTDVLFSDSLGVHGGRVLQWIDKGAYACATQWSSQYCVTAYFGHIHFTRPIPSGHLVEVRSRIAHTGRSSMHIVNEVLSADPRDGVWTRACDCLVIFVAVDENGKSTEVPSFEPSTPAEEHLKEAALSRVELREAIEEEMAKQVYTDAGTAPRLTTRFLAKPTDVNWGGKVHGGTAMEWVDEAATACSMGWVRRPTVAVYAGGIRFYKPIHIGDLVEVEARLLHTGKHAMHMSVHLRSGDPRTGEDMLQPALHCSATYVSLDDHGTPLTAPQFRPSTPEDRALWQHVETLRGLREQYGPLPLVEDEEGEGGWRAIASSSERR